MTDRTLEEMKRNAAALDSLPPEAASRLNMLAQIPLAINDSIEMNPDADIVLVMAPEQARFIGEVLLASFEIYMGDQTDAHEEFLNDLPQTDLCQRRNGASKSDPGWDYGEGA